MSTSNDTDSPRRELLESASGDTAGMLYTLYINALLFMVLVLFFEANRYMKQIYLKRLKMKFEVRCFHALVALISHAHIFYRFRNEFLLLHLVIYLDGYQRFLMSMTPSFCTWLVWTGTCYYDISTFVSKLAYFIHFVDWLYWPPYTELLAEASSSGPNTLLPMSLTAWRGPNSGRRRFLFISFRFTSATSCKPNTKTLLKSEFAT